MATLLSSLGVKENPFGEYVAENEPEIDMYFVRAPYFAAVAQRGLASRSFILFGERGAGKSASRLAFHKQVWRTLEGSESVPLVVTLDAFDDILSAGLNSVSLSGYLRQIGFSTVEAVLLWLSALSDERRDQVRNSLTQDDRRLVATTVDRYYLSRAEPLRHMSAQQTAKLLHQGLVERSAVWLERRWDKVAAFASAIGTAFVAKQGGVQVPVDATLATLLDRPHAAGSEAPVARAVIAQLVDFSRLFGFTGITVLVDKVDETAPTSNSAKASAALLYPVLANTQLMEIEGFGWVFFVWDALRKEYQGDDLPVRLDKMAHAAIHWEKDYLVQMVGKRLSHFSGGAISSLESTFAEDGDAHGAIDMVVAAAANSPRELIRALDVVFREHDDLHSEAPEPPLLTLQSIEVGLDKYSAEAAARLYREAHLRQLVRVGKSVFINKDVQRALNIKNQPATSRINEWIDAGVVELTSTRPAEGGVGGRPAHEFSIRDWRVRRMVERGISV